MKEQFVGKLNADGIFLLFKTSDITNKKDMKAKITLTVLLITGLMILAIFLAFGIVLTFGLDIKYSLGILTPFAFVIAAFIFGYCIHKVIDRINTLWE